MAWNCVCAALDSLAGGLHVNFGQPVCIGWGVGKIQLMGRRKAVYGISTQTTLQVAVCHVIVPVLLRSV